MTRAVRRVQRSGALVPDFDLVQAGGICGQATLARLAGMIGNRPAVELWHPAGDLGPDGCVVFDPCFGEQFSRRDPGLEYATVPENIGLAQPVLRPATVSPAH